MLSRPCPPAPMVLPAEGGGLSFESTLCLAPPVTRNAGPRPQDSRPEGELFRGLGVLS